MARVLSTFLEWVGRHPLRGAMAFAAVYALSVVFFVPGAALTLGGGFLFGQALGVGPGTVFASLAVFVGASAGAVAAFSLGRWLLHETAQSTLNRYTILRALDASLHGHRGLKIVLLLRLSPLVPFTALNYMMSVTSVSLKTYTLGLVGMVPAVVAYSFLGTTAGGLTREAGGESSVERGVKIAMYVVGAVALVAAVGVLSRFAREELRKIQDEGEGARGEGRDVEGGGEGEVKEVGRGREEKQEVEREKEAEER